MNKEDCVFCQIADKKINSEILYEDREIVSFHDINPQAPTHILIVPKKHIEKLSDITGTDMHLLGKLMNVAKEITGKHGFNEKGFRLVLNEGKDAGQTIYHIHMHLLSGRRFTWPPG